jgi:hypothetical protein
VFCPHPPLLIPLLAGAAAAELDDLRAVCVAAVQRLSAGGAEQLVVIGGADRSAAYSPLARGTLAEFGVPVEFHLGAAGCGGPDDLPLSLTVGAWLVSTALGPHSGARGFAVGADFDSSKAAWELLGLAQDQRIGLLVMGDGAARGSARSPGYLDERAAPYDDGVRAALRTGDADALADLDEKLGAELLVAGVPSWRAAGALLAGARYNARLDYDAAPYGVTYFVADWQSR